jgi:hypothetical protein
MIATPARSVEQRRSALIKANEIRALRSAQKKAWKKMRDRAESSASFAAMVMEPPEWAQTWKVIDALCSLRTMGIVAATTLLRQTRASDAKTLGGLSDRQRREIADALEEWSWGKRNDRCPQCAGRMAPNAARCLDCWRAEAA